PGIDKSTFAQQMVYERLKSKNKCLYFVDDKMPRAVRENMKKMGWHSDGNLLFIDGFSSLMGIKSGEKFIIKASQNVKSISETIEKAVKDTAEELFIFDSLSSMLLAHPESLKDIKNWISIVKQETVTSVFIFTNWNFENGIIEKIKAIFDYVIEMKAVEERMLLRNYFSVEKSPVTTPKTIVPFRIGGNGVAVYMPKILVTGPFHAGKSSFIHAISTRAVSVDRLGTTVALDHGYIEHSGFSADIFGTPGQEHFDFMLNILGKDAFGIILVVDSTQPASFPRALKMIEQAKSHGIPFVIAANKQDIKGALSPEGIRKRMKLPENVSIVPCVATKKKGCLDVFESLFDVIIGRGENDG
ncbi:MAG: ATPase domain-containing protein, partial [Candidatus Aenigmatarchaeota archaeon]